MHEKNIRVQLKIEVLIPHQARAPGDEMMPPKWHWEIGKSSIVRCSRCKAAGPLRAAADTDGCALAACQLRARRSRRPCGGASGRVACDFDGCRRRRSRRRRRRPRLQRRLSSSSLIGITDWHDRRLAEGRRTSSTVPFCPPFQHITGKTLSPPENVPYPSSISALDPLFRWCTSSLLLR